MKKNIGDKNVGKKYILSELYGDRMTAGSKATNDVMKILADRNYDILIYHWKRFHTPHWGLTKAELEKLEKKPKLYLKFRRAAISFCAIFALRKAEKFIKKDSVLFIQYPFATLKMKPELQASVFSKFFNRKKLEVHVLIHDLNGIRMNSEREEKSDISLLKMATKIICHNEVMKNYLVEKGLDAEKISILNFFDYLHTGKAPLPRSKNDGIAFAGNMEKSPFLWDARNLPKGINFYLYGIGGEYIGASENVHYEGKFAPAELPSKLKGAFGLVWDGASTETCNENIGNYLRFNSSHKNSLYIVSRMPIIIWKEAALSKVIEKMGIGFSVERLSEIPEKIAALSEDDYRKMLENVEALAKKLESGESLIGAYGV